MEFERTKPVANRIGLAPMIDVVFLLLIFFLLTSRFVQPLALDVELPHAARALRSAGEDAIVVGISADGRLALDGRSVGIEELTAALERETRARPDKPAVRIEADRRVPVETLVRVLDRVAGAGVERIELAAEKVSPSAP